MERCFAPSRGFAAPSRGPRSYLIFKRDAPPQSRKRRIPISRPGAFVASDRVNSLPPSSRARSSPARRQCLSRSSSLDGHCNPLFGRRLRPAEFENSSYLDPLQPRPVLFDHLGMIFPQRVFVHIEERSPPSPGLSDVAGSFPADRASRLCD